MTERRREFVIRYLGQNKKKITLGDKINGPFKLEIDWIGVDYDPSFQEELAYESYYQEFPYIWY